MRPIIRAALDAMRQRTRVRLALAFANNMAANRF
jgi:hypothetical protein